MTENSIQILPIDKVKINPKNPRTITDEAFKKLVKSIKDFPDMLNKRPIIVNDKMIILGGNKRYEAAVEAGLKEIPVIVTNWSKKQQQEFLIKDNTSFGQWEWEVITDQFDVSQLKDWGVEVPTAFDTETLNKINAKDEWVGMPEFNTVDKPFQIIISFDTEDDRNEFAKKHKMFFLKKENKNWMTQYPYRTKEDLSALKYE